MAKLSQVNRNGMRQYKSNRDKAKRAALKAIVMDRLISIAMPRVRDFRGIAGKGFDGRGNFAMGLREQIVFPEINYDRVEAVRGMDIQFVTTARTDAEAKALLKAFDLPFAN